MAESYRGLTIRIGGDTTKLTKALHTANQAVTGTQSSMKKLSDALKLDPTSLRASQLQVGEFAAQASNAATRLVTLNDAMRQVGDEIKVFNGSAATVREMAESWGNVNMVASQTRDYYQALTATLATTYTEFSKTYSEASKMASIKMTDGWELGRTSLDQMLSSVKEMSTQFNANDRQVENFTKKITSLQERYDKLAATYAEYQHAVATETDAAKFAKAAQKLEAVHQKMEKVKESFQSYIASFKGFSSDELFRYDADNTDLASLAKALYQMVQAEAMTTEQADKMYDSFARMKDEWESAFQNVKTADAVEGFHDLDAETEKATAKVKSLVDEMVRLSNTSDVAKGLVALKQELTEITNKGATAEQRLKSIFEIMSKDGNQKSTFLQREAMRDYAEATEQARAAVKNISEQLDHYDGSIRKMAAGTKSYAEETAAANEQYEKAAAALKGYEGAMNGIQDIQNKIKKDNPSGFAEDEDYQNLEQMLKAMGEVMDQLEASFQDAAAEKKKFAEIGEVRELTDKLANARDRLESFEKINFKPEVDLSAVEGLQKALEAISKGTFNTQGLSSFYDAVKVTNTALDEAKKKYQALSEVSKNDPFNKDAYQQKIAAANEVIEKTKTHIEAMKNALAAIPSDKIDKVAIATHSVSENYATARQRVEALNNEMAQTEAKIRQLKEERKGFKVFDDDSQRQANELDKRIEDLQKHLVELEKQADKALEGLDSAEATRQAEQLTTAIQESTGELRKYSAAANGIEPPKVDEAAFMQVVDRVAQAARRVASEVVQASDQIDSAYRDMRKTVNGTEEDFVRLRDAAIEYSQHSITSADQMLEMQALGGQLGIAVDNLEQFGKITSSLDIATDLDAETVALKLGQISNVLGLDIEGTQGFADALVRLGNNMPAQESSIMAVAQRFGAVAATASFSGDEILGWSAAIAATGQRSEAAATAISNTVSGIEQAVANGGSDLKQFAAIASMSAEEFKQSWKDSPTETLRAFIDGLKTLKDSDESAVAALENMGITGVRQQQTLLALTQTIGNLDDALAMSRDAWNGISDQWGQAGDAAIEAGEKSKGFSGALQIMKNNAENLAAALGDGMIPFMKAASDVMGIVTDALNALPQPIKELVVMLGASGIAFSAIIPMLRVFSGGMLDIVAAAAQTSTIGGFIGKLTGFSAVTAEMAAATEGATGLATAFSGPVVAGIAAVVAALALAIGAISDYEEKQEQFQQATIGLTTATQAATTGYDEYVAGAQESARSVGELKTALEEATEAQANLASKMQDAWSGIGASEATVDMMVDKISELSGKTGLTTEEQNELNAAVETFNNLTGNNVQVLDGESGALDTTTEALRNMAQGWKDATESAQHLEDYGDAAQALAEKQKLLDEVQSKLGDSSREQGQWFTDMRDTANSATGAYDGLAAQAQKLEQEIEALKSKMKESVSGMGDLGDQVARVEDAFLATGDSLSNYGDFTDSELRTIVEAFNNAGDGSISALERVKQAIEGLRSGANEASDIARQLEEASKEANKKEAEEYKTRAKEEYSAHKAELDAAYNDAKRSYDAMYKAQKNAFDAQYNSAKRHYDKVYNAQKNAYDKQYKQLKNRLDNELRELKNANDRKLKELKNQNDAEEREFKNATDAYLHELEKRYKAAVKTAEDETDVRIKAIDEQIRALKGQTTAEQNAIKEMKEDDKIAELRKAVDQAKSRRKREEAEKKLNDYILEVQADRNERERKKQIEALELEKQDLKDALSDKKDDLKASYEEEKYQYKTSRDEKLEQIKLANDAEYDLLKTQLDEQEELRKQNHEAQLDKMKERQAERLEALKAQQTEDLEAMKTDQEAQLDAMKTRADIALENMKASHTAELQQMQADQAAMYEMIKNGEDEVSTEIDTKQKERNANTKANAEQSAKDVGDATHGGIERLRAELEAGAPKVKTYADKLAEAGKDGPSRLRDALPKFAAEGAAGLAANLENGIPHTKSAGGNLAKYATESAAKMVLDLGKVGTGGASELSKNLDSGKDSAGKSGEQLKESVKDGASQLVDDLGEIGTSGTSNLAEGIEKNESEVENAASSAADAARTPLDELSSYSYMWGYELVSNFASGISSGVYDVGNAAYSAASAAYMYLHHSVPDKGPLADDDKWGGDLIQNIIDGMRERERDLARQAEKMARAMEDGFNPELTVDAAYEALDTIGKNRSKSLGSIIETNSAPNVTINLSMNLSNVSMRSDADIDRLARVLSQEMAAQATRQLAGRLG